MHPPIAPFHLMAKPSGPACNLDCSYCFYLKKRGLFTRGTRFRMTDAILETYIRDYLASQSSPEVTFSWQGGEPTLLGIDFFRRALDLQQHHAHGRRIVNTLQTNGTRLDDAWGRFLHDHRFLVGLSLDGPRELHDRHRRDRRGGSCFDDVMRGLAVLKRHHVEFNLLTVVSADNARHPEVVYRFLRKTGARHLQFIPLVERAAAPADDLACVPATATATAASVTPEAFGHFLCRVFDEWMDHDLGRIHVRDFEVMLGVWCGLPASLCVYAETCGRALAIEHNGDVYSCDHYVYDSHRLGNIVSTPLATLVESPFQRRFGAAKHEAVPASCRACPWWFAYHGGCPKHRFATDATGDPRLNHLCPGFKTFFAHIDRPMRRMAALLHQGRSPASLRRN